MTFDEFGLNPDLLKAIHEAGYNEPTPIQAQAIPKALMNRDILGIAQTGTGKTASFTLPMIEKLSQGRARARMPRSLILEPTRELAAQVAENFEKYGKYHKLSMALLIGGVSFGDQDKKLDRGVDVLIATPGRLLDHFERGKLMLTGVQTFVIDEADRMLDMGFIPDIERICSLLPFTRQTLLFSATMPPEIERLSAKFMQAPERIQVARQSTTAETVTQKLVKVGPREKRTALKDLIESENLKNAIIFCNRKRDVDMVAQSLKKAGLDASPIHGDLDQSVRTRTLNAFRDGSLKLLVASDVAARGLDIPEVSHVFNYDVPTHSEDYVHRIGRTGRAGRDGVAITLATPEERKYVDAIEDLIGKKIPLAGDKDDGKTDSKADEKPEVTADERADAKTENAGSGNEASSGEDEKPKRGRRRGGRGRNRRNKETGDANADGNTAEAMADDAAEAKADDKSGGKADGAKSDGGRGRGGKKANDRKDNSRKDGDRNSDRSGGGGRVVGMGDHVPAFIMRPVRPSTRTSDADADAETAESESDAA